MNICYHMDYVRTCVHIWITTPHHNMIHWILSDISEFEDLMTTSSNEDIPALKDVGY